MLMGRIMRKQRYSIVEYTMAFILVAGASMFFFSLNIKTTVVLTNEINNGTSLALINQHSTTISGLILMLTYLVFDSFTPNYQKKLLEARVSCCQVKFN